MTGRGVSLCCARTAVAGMVSDRTVAGGSRSLMHAVAYRWSLAAQCAMTSLSRLFFQIWISARGHQVLYIL